MVRQVCDLAVLREKNPHPFNNNDSFAEERTNSQTELDEDFLHLLTLFKLTRANEGSSSNLSLDKKALKGLIGIFSFTSQYLYMSAEMKMIINPILKRFFSILKLAVWNSVYYVILMYIIDNYLINQELKYKGQKGIFFNLKYYCLSVADIVPKLSSGSVNTIKSWFKNKEEQKRTLICKIISLLLFHVRQMFANHFKGFVHEVDNSMLGDKVFFHKIVINMAPSLVVSDQADV